VFLNPGHCALGGARKTPRGGGIRTKPIFLSYQDGLGRFLNPQCGFRTFWRSGIEEDPKIGVAAMQDSER
jgi:hypothetical protein